jgi:hypothetical protein
MELLEFFTKINLRNSASRWLLLQEYITMHGPLNVKYLKHFRGICDLCHMPLWGHFQNYRNHKYHTFSVGSTLTPLAYPISAQELLAHLYK